MNLLTTKIVTMVILGLSTFLIGLTTLKLRKVLGLHITQVKRWQSFMTSILLCFGAGVLLATSMLHILPETREGMEKAQESLNISCLAELVFCVGFFLVYLVEELVHLTLHFTKHSEHLHRALSLRKPAGQGDSTCNTAQACSEDSLVKPDTACSSGHSHSHLGSGTSPSLARDFFTVLALSFHAVFEGLAVGLEEDTHDVWALFTAISVHKCVISFCICLELIQSGATMLLYFSNLVIWSLVSPIGIGVGIMISMMASDEYHQLTVAILQEGEFEEWPWRRWT